MKLKTWCFVGSLSSLGKIQEKIGDFMAHNERAYVNMNNLTVMIGRINRF
jgi:hypothetical protein